MSRSSKASPRLLAIMAVAGVVSVPGVSFAAEAIEEVVVTAQRTEQSVQEVPIAVSAFSGEMMEDKQIINPSDLQLAAPNVTFTATNFGGSSFSIRGIGRLVIAGSGENGVSIHQNQIAVPTNLPAAEFYDLERVEVLRGPQGTLFGRNATGGAVNMVTRMPDYESWNGYWDVETGDYSHRRIKGALNIPVSDTFAIRMAGMALERDGYIENTAYKQRGDCVIPGTTLVDAYGESPTNEGLPNAANIQAGNVNSDVLQPCSIANIDDDIDGRDIMTYRVTASWQILDNMDAWIQYSGFREDDDKVRITNQICERNDLPTLGCTADGFGWDTPHNGSTTGGLFGGLNGAVLLGTAQPYNGFPQRGTGYRKQHTDYEPSYFFEEDMWTGGVNYDFENYRVGLLAGYVEQNYNSRQDYLMDVGNVLFATAQNPSGLWPTSDTANDQAGADWTDSQCNFNDGTSGIFGGCVMDVDQTRVFAYDQASSDSEYMTVELKLESALDGPFNFVAGAVYSEYEGYGDYYVNANTLDLVSTYGVPKLGFPRLYPGLFNSTSNPNGDGSTGDSIAYFGEVYYDLTDSLKLTVGLRYNDDHKEVSDTGILYNSVDSEVLLAGLPAPTAGFLVGVGALDAGYLTNPTAGREAGGTNWTRLTNFLLGGLGNTQTAATTERALAAYYGVSDADWNAANATPAYSAQRFAIDARVPIVPGFNEQRVLTGSPSEEDFQETTGRIGLDWQINDTTMVYGFFTRGYKPGGFNPPQNATLATETVKYIFDSEQVDSYEIGTKNVFQDGAMVVNAAAFMYDYGGLQTTRIRNNNSINDNIDAQIMGLELEMFYQPEWAPGLSIDASYAYLRAEVDGSTSLDPVNRTAGNPDYITLKNIDPGSATGVNYVARINGANRITDATITAAYAACGALSHLNANPGCPAVTTGTTYTGVAGLTQELPTYFSRNFLNGAGIETSDGLNVDLDGNSLPNAPENTFHIGAAYTWQIDQIAGALTARWDWSWRDDQYAREFNTKGDFIESWDQHNAALIYESNDGQWEGRLWIRNLLNDDNITGKYLTSDTSGLFRNYFLTEPRLFGASLKYSFGEQ